MANPAFPRNWHTAAFGMVSGVALMLLITGPEPGAPRMPAGEHHANRWEFGSCPECHDPADLPADHRTTQKTLHPLFSRCYLCHH